MKRRRWAWVASVCAIALVWLLSACTPQAPTSESPDGAEPTAPLGAEPPAVQSGQLPRLQGQATVEMQVNGQRILIALEGQDAPITAGNFVDLVNRGVYNGTRFHRVEKDPRPFVVQGGDPSSTDPKVPIQSLGRGGFVDPDSQRPRTIPLEIVPEGADQPIYSQTLKAAKVSTVPKLQHTRGAIAMARSPLPDSASSQFYFALADLPFLDGDYAVFGYVSEGMDAVDQIQPGDVLTTASVTDGLDNLQR